MTVEEIVTRHRLLSGADGDGWDDPENEDEADDDDDDGADDDDERDEN